MMSAVNRGEEIEMVSKKVRFPGVILMISPVPEGTVILG